jgi:hypothetical protein
VELKNVLEVPEEALEVDVEDVRANAVYAHDAIGVN